MIRYQGTLEDACELIADCPHTTAKDEGEGYPLVRTPNIGFGRLVYDKMHRVSESVYNCRNRRAKPVAGDLIYAREAPAGNVALITAGENVCLGQRTVLIRPKRDVVNSVYLTYYLLDPSQRNRLLSTASGATVTHVNLPAIRGLSVSFPDLKLQNQIADILGAYDDLIENNRRRIELLEKMARELYRERFVRRATQGVELSLMKMFDYVRGKSYASNEIDVSEGVPMINLKNIKAWGGYKAGAERLFSGDYKSEQTLSCGDVIMGVTDMTQDRRIVGHVAIVPTLDQTATFSMDIIKLIPKEISRVELYTILRFSGVSKEISQLATGATVLHLRPNALDSVHLRIPRKSDFAEVEDLFGNYYSEMDKLALQNRNLVKQRDRLLPRLMSGKIELDKLVKEAE